MAPGNTTTVLSTLALLATGGVVLLAGGFALLSLLRGRLRLARLAVVAGGSVALIYLAVLAATGLASRQRLLAPGDEKYFCELDCHLAYQVVDLRSPAASADAGPQPWTVTLRTRFDEATISPRRGTDRPTRPAPKRIALVTTDGQQYPALDPQAGASALLREVRPGESYLTELVFELPAGARPAGLLVVNDLFLSRWLIGQESGLLHAPTLLGLPATA